MPETIAMPSPLSNARLATPRAASPAGRVAAHLPVIVFLLSMLTGTAFIVGTYSRLSQTWDESAHIGTGMEWLSRGIYTLDPIDPPLARVSTAVGPYLLGSRTIGDRNPWDEGDKILGASGNLQRTLIAARLGILPYFLLACFLTWTITRRWLGPWPAAIASFLFATCPPVLAHAAIATTDVAFVATFLFALDRMWLALQRPRPLYFLLAGLGVGLACLAKLSAVPYVGLCAIAFLLYMALRRRHLPRFTHGFLFFIAAAFTIWAGYHFSVGSLATSDPQSQQTIARAAHKFGPLERPVAALVRHFPAYQFVQGLRVAQKFRHNPPMAYLFGEAYHGGRWYFFFVVLLIKTPIPFLILGLAGLGIATWRLWMKQDDFALVPLAGVLLPIAFATQSHINLGVRHVLVIYPFLAMLAALASLRLYQGSRKPKWLATGIVGALLGWQLVACAIASPDFLTYLNEPARPFAGYLVADSDYDWGQDLLRLCSQLRALHATDVSIAYSGSADPHMYDLPPWKKLNQGEQATGWIAVSETYLRWYPRQFTWLTSHKPVAMAGNTIRIYHIE